MRSAGSPVRQAIIWTGAPLSATTFGSLIVSGGAGLAAGVEQVAGALGRAGAAHAGEEAKHRAAMIVDERLEPRRLAAFERTIGAVGHQVIADRLGEQDLPARRIVAGQALV